MSLPPSAQEFIERLEEIIAQGSSLQNTRFLRVKVLNTKLRFADEREMRALFIQYMNDDQMLKHLVDYVKAELPHYFDMIEKLMILK
jgi:hypothetical protein